MKTVIRQTLEYRCDICRTLYTNQKNARRCNRKQREKRVFKVGDRVQAKKHRACGINRKTYIVRGMVTKISGPRPPDFYYEVTCIQIPERLSMHVYEYDVEFVCPHCKETRNELYYAPEIKDFPQKEKIKKTN